MNIDDMKTVWKQYDRKIASSRQINEKIILSMITERSGHRFARVRTEYVTGIAWMIICLSFCVLAIVTNPFDYSYRIQYVPFFIFGSALAIMIVDMLRSYAAFLRISLTQFNVGESLKRIIAVYEKPKRFLRYVIILFLFSQVVLFPLSFLPRNIERMGLGQALVERLIPIAIGALLLFVAYKLGAFKERHAARFKQDLNELDSLRKMAAELE